MRNDPILACLPIPAEVPPNLLRLGFRFGDIGTHTSRTIMLQDLDRVLGSCPDGACRSDYLHQVVEQNCLGKHTLATRRSSFQRLSELYGIDPGIPLFRWLCILWKADEHARPLLALLTSLARDPLLRSTAPAILHMQPGEELTRRHLLDALKQAVQERFNDNILDKVCRNAASSWTQSGHLLGRTRKMRSYVKPTPTATAYALLLGYALGLRGQSLFSSIFARTLDADISVLMSLSSDARKLGLLDMKNAGGVILLSFDAILSEQERRLTHGAH